MWVGSQILHFQPAPKCPWVRGLTFVRSYVIIFICFSHLFHLLLCALALFLFLCLAFICVLCSVAKLYLTLLNYYLFQSLSHVPLYKPLEWSMPVFAILHYLLEFAQIHVHWAGDATQLSHCVSSPYPPAFNLSQHQRLFQWVISSHQVPKYWSFSFNISPSSEYTGLISFRVDWLDLLTVQGTLKSLLQHHSSKASILLCSAFFIVQLSHPYTNLLLIKEYYILFDSIIFSIFVTE